MNKLEKLIRELLEKGFCFSGVYLLETGEIAYELQGFYKSGTIKLYQDDNYIYALARYNEITELSATNPFDSLVDLNYEWWQKSKNKWSGWEKPEQIWTKYLLEKGLIKEEKHTITTYEENK